MKTFAQTIKENISLKNILMKEFEVAESTVDRWANGIANPHPLIKKAVLDFIVEQRSKGEVSEHLRAERQKLVEKILLKYDPAGMIKQGGLETEYSGEASQIIRQFSEVSTVDDLFEVIWAVFVVNFNFKQAGDKAYYRLIAGEVWEVRNLRKEEVAVNKAVNMARDRAMNLVGNKMVSVAKDAATVAGAQLSKLSRVGDIFKKKE